MMKAVLFSIIMAGCMPVYCQYADDYHHESLEGIERGDNVITINTNMSAGENYHAISLHLAQHGFTFKSRDAELLIISTEPKHHKNGLEYAYALDLICKGADIIIRPRQSGMSVGASLLWDPEIIWKQWHYATSSGNIYNQSFRDFYPVLKDYGYPMQFSRE
jgi:hypothetical protein